MTNKTMVLGKKSYALPMLLHVEYFVRESRERNAKIRVDKSVHTVYSIYIQYGEREDQSEYSDIHAERNSDL